MNAGSAYSDLKSAYHIIKISQLRESLQIVPPHVQLIISDLCNQDCGFCSYRISTGFSSEEFGEIRSDGTRNMNPNRMISFDKCDEILKDLSELGVKAIQFTGGGEPTAHPRHLEIFRIALVKGMECALVTNAVILKDGWRDVIPNLSWIRVSLDAGSADTYSKVRRTSSRAFPRVLGHIASMSAQIENDNSECVLGVGYVVTPGNYKEIVDGCRLAKDTGASYIRLSAMFSKQFIGPYLGIYDYIKDSISQAKSELTDNGFQIVDLFGDRIDDLRQSAPEYDFCGYQQFNMYIGANLKVYRCCTTSYTKHGEVGDLSSQSFKEWFNSMEKEIAYSRFKASSCRVCQFNNKNRIINYMIQGSPTHVNFV